MGWLYRDLKKELVERLRGLKEVEFTVEFSRVNKSGISAVYVDIKVPDEKRYRHLPEIEKIIQKADLSDAVKERAISIFRSLAEAEAKVHGIAVEKVHFHEVGALDSIADIVGACVGFEMLGVEHFACSPINVGRGFIEISHGKFPIPAPATTELLKGALIYSTDIQAELITPTGAAIISTVCKHFGAMPQMRLQAVSYGAGKQDFERFPNVLRLLLGEIAQEDLKTETLKLIETNVDDVSPEVLGFLMEKAFKLGALDCWFTPIQMKKNRPASLISILCRTENEEDFCKLLFEETATLGVRIQDVRRQAVSRDTIFFESRYGSVRLKKSMLNDKILNVKPEYEDLSQIAMANNKSIREVEAEILREFEGR